MIFIGLEKIFRGLDHEMKFLNRGTRGLDYSFASQKTHAVLMTD